MIQSALVQLLFLLYTDVTSEYHQPEVQYRLLWLWLSQQDCDVQSWSAPGQSLQAQTQQKIDAQKKTDAEQPVQEGPIKAEDAKADKAAEKTPASAVPELSQEIKGLLGLAYPDLVAVAATACDAWTKGQTEACFLLL